VLTYAIVGFVVGGVGDFGENRSSALCLQHDHEMAFMGITGYNIWITIRYLADDFRLAGHGRPGSRSAASMMLDVPRTTTSLGDRAFAVAGPRVWNSLPPAIRDPSLSPSIFGKLLKTYLFV